jgi:HK97 family phage portal protein
MFLDTLLAPAPRGSDAPAAATVIGGSSLAYPSDWVTRTLGGTETSSGVTVDEDVAMRFSAVFCAVSVYCNAFKTLPWRVYRHRDGGGKDLARDHALYRVLATRPNPEMTPGFFKSYVQGCKLLWGNGYAEIKRDRRSGQAVALWPLHPTRVIVERVNRDRRIIYRVNRDDGMQDVLEQSAMFHVRGPSRDGVCGLSRVGLMRESIGLSLAAEEHGGKFFGSGAHIGGVLSLPPEAEKLNDEAIRTLRESLIAHFSGPNRFTPAVLQEGAKWESIGMPNEDAQFIETRTFQIRDVARFFNLPPHKLADLADATFSNVGDQQVQYATESLAPETVDFNEEADRKLFLEDEQETYFTKLDLRGAMRGSHQERAEYYKAMWEMGVYSINDILEMEDMNPIGPAGDAHYVQLNLTTAEQMAAKLAEMPADTSASEELAFKRELVKLLVADGTIGDVVYNQTDGQRLLEEVNVPIYRDENGQPVEEPWLPVVAQPGPLVSGDVIEDPDGEVVGGDVVRGEAAGRWGAEMTMERAATGTTRRRGALPQNRTTPPPAPLRSKPRRRRSCRCSSMPSNGSPGGRSMRCARRRRSTTGTARSTRRGRRPSSRTSGRRFAMR